MAQRSEGRVFCFAIIDLGLAIPIRIAKNGQSLFQRFCTEHTEDGLG
jgi:hypothetical protein